MPSSSMLAAVVALSAAATTAAAQKGQNNNANLNTAIAVSGDVTVGIFFGFALIGMLAFAVSMLTSIEASDKIGQPKNA
jgi:hypothetical protein